MSRWNKPHTTSQHTRVGPVTIHYQTAGSGPALLLIHGLSGSSRWWRKNIGPLAERFRVYIVDLVGFGGSRNWQIFALDKAATYLAVWMRQLQIKHATIVGHSMGGYIAAELAADCPDLVERLILVDAATLPFNDTLLSHGWGMVREARHVRLDFVPVLMSDALRAGALTLWKATVDLFFADLRPKLERISVPTLVVWGEHDALIPLEAGRRLRRYLRYDELVVVKGAGHNPMWDCPNAFNQVVTEFALSTRPVGEERLVECVPVPATSSEAPATAQD